MNFSSAMPRLQVISLLILSLTLIVTQCKKDENAKYISQVPEFTRYYLHFGGSRWTTGVCLPSDAYNETYISLLSKLDRCPRPNYWLRQLSSSQISWKSKKKAIANGTNVAPPPSQSNKTKDIIHNYLAFAMMLPKHPFSSDMYKSLVTVGPMFPEVTIVMGSGYEFLDMCAQYSVRSFPQLLFFKKGLLQGRYVGEHRPDLLAGQFARWTKSLPRSLPNAYQDLRLVKKKDLSANQTLFSPGSVLFQREIFGQNITMKVPFSSEPIVGSIEDLVPYDSVVIMLAGIYTIGRLMYWLYKSISH